MQEILINLESDLKKIDQIILDFAQGKSPLIQEISYHLIEAGGKRIRPILLLLAAKLCGTKSGDNHHNLAATVELIHSATLLHDDVVDTSQIRRGKKTANAIWDNKASILVGDFLFSIAFQLMVRCSNLRVLDLLSTASSVMANGEIMQLQNSSDVTLSQEKYLEIIFGKTAVLFAAACECGALINECSEVEISALRNFGSKLGTIFQIVDDILDYSSKENVLGKDIGNDFFEGKATLPIILTYEKSNAVEKKMISDIFTKNSISSERDQNDFAEILALIERYDGLSGAKDLALTYHKLALEDLKIFPESPKKEDLIRVLNYSLSRIS